MLKLIPTDIEHFNTFIKKTDDCQHEMMERIVFPLKSDGSYDFASPNKKTVNEPAWQRWGWTEVESLRWSRFRRDNDELHKSGKKELLEKNIAECIAFEEEHRLIHRLIEGRGTKPEHEKAFGIWQDIIQHKTKLRTFTLRYEKQIPLSDYEKMFIKKYIELHEHVYASERKLCSQIKETHGTIPDLWEKIYVAKYKIDKATNHLYLPPAEMKGDFSPTQFYKVPTEEEQHKMVEDCNKYLAEFGKETDRLCERTNAFDELVYAESYYEGHDAQQDPLFVEVEKMHNELYDNSGKYSIEPVSLYNDFQEFCGASSDENKKTMAAWDDFILHENVFMEVYNTLMDVNNYKAEQHSENNEDADDTDSNITGSEIDDIRAETIQRYESGTAAFFDVDDWHIILDNYEQKYDQKNKADALEKAFTQHPQNATLMLRKAQDEMGKHEYQKALELIKQAEAQGPPHHPNLFFIKGDVYLQMHAPELAIPLYNRLIAAKGEGAEKVHQRARLKLADIYASQEKYDECIELSKEMLKSNPDDENIVANLSLCYQNNGMLKEAQETVENYLKKFPESVRCMEQLGKVYIEAKDFYKAAKLFEDCYDMNPCENHHILNEKGKIMMELKHFNSAVVCFETCLFHYHIDKDIHMNAARCYTELKMPYAARFHYHKAIEIDPNCLEAAQQIQQSRLNN